MSNPTTEIEYLLAIPIGGLEVYQLLHLRVSGVAVVFTRGPKDVDITPYLCRLGALLVTGPLQHHIAAQCAAQYAQCVAQSAQYATQSAQCATQYAQSAAQYAQYAAQEQTEYTTEYAQSATQYATEYAQYAAQSAQYTTEYAQFAPEYAQCAAQYLLLCETIVSALEASHIPNKE